MARLYEVDKSTGDIILESTKVREKIVGGNRIQSDPKVMMGKPVISGTRITVESILEQLAAGETIDQIIEAHPRLTREDIMATLDFASRALRADVVYPISGQAG